MRNSVCLLYLCAVSYLTERYSCLNRIDLPLTVEMSSDGRRLEFGKKKSPLSRPEAFNIYLSNNPDEMPEKYLKKTRRIQTILPKIKHENLLGSKEMPSKSGIQGIQINIQEHKSELPSPKKFNQVYPPVRSTTPKFDIRRYFPPNADANLKAPMVRTGEYEDEKDANLKTKISTLVQQTIHDTERKIKSIQHIKDKNREEAPYKAGFILSMIKKSRDVLNELFNVAVKHKDEWKALEQLKIFELIVHTNVDTTNLVRQLVEIHIQHLNATNPDHDKKEAKRRVVLL